MRGKNMQANLLHGPRNKLTRNAPQEPPLKERDEGWGRVKRRHDGTIHCPDGPAIILHPGSEFAIESPFDGIGPDQGQGRGRLSIYGPAELWLQDGKLHREDGPAVIETYEGSEEEARRRGVYDSKATYSIEPGRLYREVWIQNGKLHREDAPAVIVHGPRIWYFGESSNHDFISNGATGQSPGTCYYRHGKLHREDGPAAVSPLQKRQRYYLDGKKYKTRLAYKRALKRL
jgi:hypothetical protein